MYIDIKTEEESSLVLTSLSNLIKLNGKSTKLDTEENNNNYYSGENSNNNDENNLIILDLIEPEITNISLDNEKPLFTQIYSIVSEKLKNINKDQSELFLHDFEILLKSEIQKINNCVEINSPNYIYATKVLDSELKILNFFHENYLKYLKINNEEIYNVIQIISSHSNEISNKIVDIINRLYPKIDELSNKFNQIFFNQENQYMKDKELIMKNLEEENNLLKEKLENLESENKLMIEKLFNSAQLLVNKGVNVLPKTITRNNNTYNNLNFQNMNSLKKNSSTISINNNNNTIQQTPYGNRVFTLKMMKDVINDIYNSKVDFDKKCDNNQMPHETLEQHMYTYLNYKYGLKNIIIEWATNIINGIKSFSSEDSEVCLFGKILRNEIEEDSRLFLPMLKANFLNVLTLLYRRNFPLKNNCDIDNLINQKMKSSLTYDECKEILYNLYEENDANYLEQKVIEKINQKKENLLNKPIQEKRIERRKKLTRDELLLIGQQKEENCNTVSYNFLLRICHEFQIKIREKYLKNFVKLFKTIDEDNNGIINEEEFIELVKSLKIYNEENLEENIERLLNTIDPYSNKQITFSECVSLFSMEQCPNIENQKLSIMDKVCISQ